MVSYQLLASHVAKANLVLQHLDPMTHNYSPTQQEASCFKTKADNNSRPLRHLSCEQVRDMHFQLDSQSTIHCVDHKLTKLATLLYSGFLGGEGDERNPHTLVPTCR